MNKIIFSIATRLNKDDFYKKTLTGKSLKYFNIPIVEIDLYDKNTQGLPTIYNQSIEKHINDDAIMIFAHDDLLILDFFWMKKVIEGLSNYDLVGIVGNRSRIPFQPSWAFIDTKGTWDKIENLSGVIGHGDNFPGNSFGVFGPNSEVEILDGLFLATTTKKLKQHQLRFDPIFDFHFYDLDFCRTIRNSGLKLATIPISVIHQSKGNFISESWGEGYRKYIRKWGN